MLEADNPVQLNIQGPAMAQTAGEDERRVRAPEGAIESTDSHLENLDISATNSETEADVLMTETKTAELPKDQTLASATSKDVTIGSSEFPSRSAGGTQVLLDTYTDSTFPNKPRSNDTLEEFSEASHEVSVSVASERETTTSPLLPASSTGLETMSDIERSSPAAKVGPGESESEVHGLGDNEDKPAPLDGL